jgi:hydrogenase nickel incorporation protein HypB
MCKDCGCETARDGGKLHHHHAHADGVAHSHPHDHGHPHGHDHAHPPVPMGMEEHIHTHEHADGMAHEHPHEHGHMHTHGHQDAHDHMHGHGDAHGHPHPHEHPDEHGATRTIALQQRVLDHNDRIAAENRIWLAERRIVALNFISSPGTGKTLLLERTIERIRDRVACAVIAGDQNTDNDKRRLDRTGVPVVQIETHSSCHLDAERVAQVLPHVVRKDTRLLFIENVGNLVCPAAFDLGETFKVGLLSTTEGEDKPVKYPVLFTGCRVVVLTKTDLIPHLDWDLAACRRYIQQVNPGVYMFELSAKTGDGLDSWCDYLEKLVT